MINEKNVPDGMGHAENDWHNTIQYGFLQKVEI